MKPPNYSIKVKRPGSNRWEVFGNIVGDTTYLADGGEEITSDVVFDDPDKKKGRKIPLKIVETKKLMPVKVFFFENNERLEIGMGPGVMILYSVERYYHIKEEMSNEAGQDIKTVQ